MDLTYSILSIEAFVVMSLVTLTSGISIRHYRYYTKTKLLQYKLIFVFEIFVIIELLLYFIWTSVFEFITNENLIRNEDVQINVKLSENGFTLFSLSNEGFNALLVVLEAFLIETSLLMLSLLFLYSLTFLPEVKQKGWRLYLGISIVVLGSLNTLNIADSLQLLVNDIVYYMPSIQFDAGTLDTVEGDSSYYYSPLSHRIISIPLLVLILLNFFASHPIKRPKAGTVKSINWSKVFWILIFMLFGMQSLLTPIFDLGYIGISVVIIGITGYATEKIPSFILYSDSQLRQIVKLYEYAEIQETEIIEDFLQHEDNLIEYLEKLQIAINERKIENRELTIKI